MKCLACDVVLSDFEATRKYQESGKYVDLCNHCYKTVAQDINAIERPDLLTNEEAYEDDYKFKEYQD
jgi:hypothetical protein